MKAEEVARFRRWECEQEGHVFDVITSWQVLDPVKVVCARCGETWDVSRPTSEEAA